MDGDWRDYYDSISVLRSDNLNGRKVYILQLTHGELPPETIFIDAASGDILKSMVIAIQEGGIGIPITTLYEDYRKVHGLRMPFRSVSSNDQSGRTVIQWEKIEVNLNFYDDFFILEPPTK